MLTDFSPNHVRIFKSQIYNTSKQKYLQSHTLICLKRTVKIYHSSRTLKFHQASCKYQNVTEQNLNYLFPFSQNVHWSMLVHKSSITMIVVRILK